jgi:regulator of cell morphogenesis and NO signaling
MGRPLSLIWFRRFNHTNKVFLFQYPNLHKLFYALLDIDQFNFFQSIVLYNQVKETHLKTLAQYVPVVAKVHGGNHPEFYQVRKVYDELAKKAKDAGVEKPDLKEEFVKLREITDNYTVPGDVCESYEAVYNMLAELDKAYEA